MPSEQEVAKEGINLGEMDKLLTKKVEELTLYLIEKDKELKEEQAKNVSEVNRLDLQQKDLKQQEQEIELLKQQMQILINNSKANLN